jgi:cobalt-zinc-cadmium efflux system membrane fusion protein
MAATSILLVDDDPVLSQVLQRVLAREGYHVVEAATAADALRLVAQQQPKLALMDLSSPDGDSMELVRALKREDKDLPLILMTADPHKVRDQPELDASVAQVLAKPLNLEELRQSIHRVLSGKTSSASVPARSTGSGTWPSERLSAAQLPPAPTAHAQAAPAGGIGRMPLWATLIALVLVIALLTFGLPALGIPSITDWFKPRPAVKEGEIAATGARLASELNDAVELPPDVVEHLGVKTTVVTAVATPRRLELAGSLSFDLNHLYRIQSRFGGEVIALGTTLEMGTTETQGRTRERPLRYGDYVQKGDLLAVVFSKDLGEKKSELVDSIVKLYVDQQALNRYEEMAARGVLPEATLLQQRATVAMDRNAVVRVERTLLTWRVSNEEIAAVRAEARRVQKDQSLRDLAKETEWAKVEVRAPAGGVIVEKNVAVGNIVDTTFDLYKIADLRELGVIVHAYEEDLESLRELTLPHPWEVRLAADPNRPLLKGRGLEQIGRIVDPSQHTAPVMGLVDNPNREMEVGQFVSATVLLPAPRDVVSLPASALDEDGSSSVVFIQPDAARHVYQRRRVLVTQRLGDQVYVRSVLSDQQKAQGLSEVRPGERVVTQGVVELKSTLADLRPKK